MSESAVGSRSSSPSKTSRPGSRAGKESDEESGGGKKEVKRNRKLKIAPKNATEIFSKQAVVEAPTKYKKVKFSKIKLSYKMTDGTTKDLFIENRDISSYLQLQMEICKMFPLSKSMWMVQSVDGKMLTADNFQEKQVYNIREIASRKLETMKFIPQTGPYWEFQEYHAAPKNWKMKKPKEKPVVVIDATNPTVNAGLDAEGQVKSAYCIFSKKEPP